MDDVYELVGDAAPAVPSESQGPSTASPADDGADRPTGSDPLTRVYLLGFALAGWYVGLQPLSDNSFLWHLRTGRLMLEQGIPHTDPYSFSAPGIAWIAQSWLAEAAYGLAERLAGSFGIRLLIGVTGALIAVVLFRTARAVVGDRRRATLFALTAWLVTLSVFNERPLAFGLLAMAVLVRMVEAPRVPGRTSQLRWQLPVLLWLWANAHGTFSLGLAYLALVIVGDWLDGARPWATHRDLIIGAVVGTAAIVANPYGLGLLSFPVQLVSRGEVLANVIEWSSPSFRATNGMLLAGWMVLLVVALARGLRHPSRRDVLVGVVFVLLALWAQRNIGLAAVVTLPVVGRQLARPVRTAAVDRGFVIVAAGSFLVLAVVATVAAAGRPGYVLDAYPVKAMRHLEVRDGLGTRLLTTDAWAGFVIERYGPDRQKVFLDDRFDMYPPELVADYDAMADGKPDWRRQLDRHRIETVVWPRQRTLSQLLALDDAWREVYRDRQAVVFVRR